MSQSDNKNYEIEKKYLTTMPPLDLSQLSSKEMVQGYISHSPVIRIRKEVTQHVLTIKGPGRIKREEYELPISQEDFNNLLQKIDGQLIKKTRYYIPYGSHIIEFDVFKPPFQGLLLAEVEFDTETDTTLFKPPAWFIEDVTPIETYNNSALARLTPTEAKVLMEKARGQGKLRKNSHKTPNKAF